MALWDSPPLICQPAPTSLIRSLETHPKLFLLHFSISDSNCIEALCVTHTREREIRVRYTEINPGSQLLNSDEFLQI